MRASDREQGINKYWPNNYLQQALCPTEDGRLDSMEWNGIVEWNGT